MYPEDNRRNSSQQSAPRWVIWAVAVLAAAVIALGVGITATVLWIQAERQVEQAEVIAAANTTAPQTTPIIIIQSPTPQPTETQADPTATVPDATAEPITVAREELTDLAPQTTAVPIVTVTAPPDGSIVAPRVDTPFIIDGDLEGWSGISSYTSAYRVFNQVWWDETDDLTAFWRVSWDNINLYVSVVVIDDVHVQTQQAQTAFRGDSLELQIDTDRTGDADQLINVDDFQIVLSPGDFKTIAPGAFRYRGNADNKMGGAPGDSIAVSAVKTDEGYVLEAAIPWDDLELRPVDNMVLGIALNANDTDIVGGAVQVLMKSSIPTRTFDNPSTWGELVLTNN